MGRRDAQPSGLRLIVLGEGLANGYITVASKKSDVRMVERFGMLAKTNIPALGDPITGLDVTADSRCPILSRA